MKYNNLSNVELLEQYDKLIRGHTQAKKVLINTLNHSLIRHYQKWILQLKKSEWIATNKVLLIGGSGTGKTFLLECLQDIIDFPFLRLDATHLNPTGAGGGMKPDKVKELIREYAKQLVMMSRGMYPSVDGTIDRMVVFVDEVDKLATCWESSGQWNRHVQSNFLTLFEDNDEFAGVTWIFAGAFTGLEQDSKSKSIGFNCAAPTDIVTSQMDDALIKYGLLTEFVGRITHIVELDKFTREDYRDILVDIIIPKKLKDLACFNVHAINISDEEIDALVERAVKSCQGIRYLKRELDKYTLDAEFYHTKSLPRLEEVLNEKDEDGMRYDYYPQE